MAKSDITNTDTKMNNKESVDKTFEKFHSARLDEMARVGFLDGEFEIYVWTDDSGHIPHIHVRDTNARGGNYETCIKLKTNEYFLHGHYTDKMNASMRKAFNNFMHAPCINTRYQNNYDFAVDMWNHNNSSTIITPEYDAYGNIIVPDYTTIKD